MDVFYILIAVKDYSMETYPGKLLTKAAETCLKLLICRFSSALVDLLMACLQSG